MEANPNPSSSVKARFFSWPFSWRGTRRALIGFIVLLTLVAIAYAEENWRGKRAWEHCKRELESKGEVIDWHAYIPPPIPDEQNVFKAPKMTEWFVKGSGQTTNTELSQHLSNPKTHSIITNKEAAADYLAWSEQHATDFEIIREGLKRPFARIDGDYNRPYAMARPHFVAIRDVVQTLAQRARCYLVLRQPENALRELSLIREMSGLLEGKPTGKPMTLVTAMINVAVTGLYADVVTDGLQSHAWREPELIALEKQLRQIDLLPLLPESCRSERAAFCHALEISKPSELVIMRELPASPLGWTYLNMANLARMEQSAIDVFDSALGLVMPQKLEKFRRDVEKMQSGLQRYLPSTMMALIALPNHARATKTVAGNQTKVNQTRIVCALERYRLAHGEYPETFAALLPQFIEKLPPDIIGGQPLKYRPTSDGKFLLYSIGWNEKDDGGVAERKKGTWDNQNTDDWVWGATVQ